MAFTRRPRPPVLLLLLLATLCNASLPATRLFHLQARRKHSHPSKKQARPTSVGSLIRFQRPTTERVSQWFARSSTTAEFNHDDVGMTNPCLHIDLLDSNNDAKTAGVVQASSSTTSGNDSRWWPTCSSPPNGGWKCIQLSRRVGWGLSCYNAVRDACLEWTFDGKENGGIVQVHSHSHHAEQYYQRRDSYGTGYDVVHNMAYGDGNLYGPSGESAIKIWSGPGGRNLCTFTQVFRSKWLPRLFCVNPVTVVYDLVDQRGPGTTFTSTAYATDKGHWLRGEERLTVAHRDDGEVDVEILSYSKHGNSLWGRMIWPFVGPLQGRFFESQMTALEHVAAHVGPQGDVQERRMGATPINSIDGDQTNRRGSSSANEMVIRRW